MDGLIEAGWRRHWLRVPYYSGGRAGGGCLVLESRDSFLSPRVLSSTPCLPFFILENESYSPPPTFNPIFKNLYPNLKKYAFFEYVIQAFGIKFKDTPGTKKSRLFFF